MSIIYTELSGQLWSSAFRYIRDNKILHKYKKVINIFDHLLNITSVLNINNLQISIKKVTGIRFQLISLSDTSLYWTALRLVKLTEGDRIR